MTRSQKIARIFEIVDYVLLAPVSFFLFLNLLVTFQAPFFGGIIWAIAAVGFVLMYGCIRHSRRLLSRRKSILLWTTMMIYNLAQAVSFVSFGAHDSGLSYLSMPALLGLTVFVLSTLALRDDLKRIE
jgi:hypothetical protein